MKTSELTQFLKSEPFTDDQAYNLIVSDMGEYLTPSEIEDGQDAIRYFAYKIQSVCLRAIREIKEESHAGTAQ